jgi:hypothetical protein
LGAFGIVVASCHPRQGEHDIIQSLEYSPASSYLR